MNRYRVAAGFLLVVIFGSWLFPAQAAQPVQPLQLGVLPNVSARVILANYQPIRQFLERELKRPVDVVTAPDFKTFFQRTQAGDYDIVITAANFARLAQTEAGYTPLGSYQPAISGLLVMSKADPVRDVSELRGSALAMANPQSLVALRGIQWLKERGLAAGTDFSTVKAANEDSLGQMILKGESRMAMLSNVEFRQVPEQHRRNMEVFVVFSEVPSFVWLMNARQGAAEAGALKIRMMGLSKSEEGKRLFAATGFQGWKAISEAELAAMDPHLAETKKMLGLAR